VVAVSSFIACIWISDSIVSSVSIEGNAFLLLIKSSFNAEDIPLIIDEGSLSQSDKYGSNPTSQISPDPYIVQLASAASHYPP
jgi:hypothetical protein